jgi:hypothetical protein
MNRIKFSTHKKYLNVFYSVKTHKEKPYPYRAIVDSTGTWQHELETFLLKGLNLLEPNDPFWVKNSEEAVERLNEFHCNSSFDGFSMDACDMYFNISHDLIQEVVEEEIAKFGITKFESDTGAAVFGFIKLLQICWKSSIVKDEVSGKIFRQKLGVCIGSWIAPRIADLFTAKMNRAIFEDLKYEFEGHLLEILKFVDDYLILFNKDISKDRIIDSFNQHRTSLEFTQELTNDKGEIQFLDLLVLIKSNSICWRNQQRKAKGTRCYASALRLGV